MISMVQPLELSVSFPLKQGSICETRKDPNRAPIQRGVDYLLYVHVLENHNFEHLANFGQYTVDESGPNCQKAHPHAMAFHLRSLPRLYDHPLQRNSLEKLMFKKNPLFREVSAIFGQLSETESYQISSNR